MVFFLPFFSAFPPPPFLAAPPPSQPPAKSYPTLAPPHRAASFDAFDVSSVLCLDA